MKKKSLLIATIILMSIGFAAISTTLIINGSTTISENNDDFDVIFTAASRDGEDVYNSVVDSTKKTLTFETKELKSLNQVNLFGYKITNNSSNYDAEVRVVCGPKTNTTTKYTTIENDLDGKTNVIKAKESMTGTFIIKLIKTATENVTEEYTCTLQVNAVERNSLGTDNNSTITKTGTNIGDQICLNTECFYIINNTGDNYTMLAKYNLYVGGRYDGDLEEYVPYGNEQTGLQDASMTGHNGVVAYSENGNSYGTSSAKDNYITGYIGKLENLKYNGVDFNHDTVRLITKDELTSLGCSVDDATCTGSKYSWVYSTSYWTMTPFENGSETVYTVSSDGELSAEIPTTNFMRFGIRPVVVIPKSIVK